MRQCAAGRSFSRWRYFFCGDLPPNLCCLLNFVRSGAPTGALARRACCLAPPPTGFIPAVLNDAAVAQLGYTCSTMLRPSSCLRMLPTSSLPRASPPTSCFPPHRAKPSSHDVRRTVCAPRFATHLNLNLREVPGLAASRFRAVAYTLQPPAQAMLRSQPPLTLSCTGPLRLARLCVAA